MKQVQSSPVLHFLTILERPYCNSHMDTLSDLEQPIFAQLAMVSILHVVVISVLFSEPNLDARDQATSLPTSHEDKFWSFFLLILCIYFFLLILSIKSNSAWTFFLLLHEVSDGNEIRSDSRVNHTLCHFLHPSLKAEPLVSLGHLEAGQYGANVTSLFPFISSCMQSLVFSREYRSAVSDYQIM